MEFVKQITAMVALSLGLAYVSYGQRQYQPIVFAAGSNSAIFRMPEMQYRDTAFYCAVAPADGAIGISDSLSANYYSFFADSARTKYIAACRKGDPIYIQAVALSLQSEPVVLKTGMGSLSEPFVLHTGASGMVGMLPGVHYMYVAQGTDSLSFETYLWGDLSFYVSNGTKGAKKSYSVSLPVIVHQGDSLIFSTDKSNLYYRCNIFKGTNFSFEKHPDTVGFGRHVLPQAAIGTEYYTCFIAPADTVVSIDFQNQFATCVRAVRYTEQQLASQTDIKLRAGEALILKWTYWAADQAFTIASAQDTKYVTPAPYAVDESATELALDFSTDTVKYIDTRLGNGRVMIIHTPAKGVRISSADYSAYSVPNKWGQTAILQYRKCAYLRITAPAGSQVVLYFKREQAPVPEADTNVVADADLFSIHAYSMRYSTGHLLYTDKEGDNPIFITANGLDLNANGEMSDLQYNTTVYYINTSAAPFTWYRVSQPYVTGESSYNADTVSGPGCGSKPITRNVFYKNAVGYNMVYKVASDCRLRAEFSAGCVASPDINGTIQKAGTTIAVRVQIYPQFDTLYYRFEEIPLSAEERKANGAQIDTMHVNGTLKDSILPICSKYAGVFTPPANGFLYLEVTALDGTPFTGKITPAEYGYRNNTYPFCVAGQSYSFSFTNPKLLQLKLNIEFRPLQRGDLKQMPLAAHLGMNTGANARYSFIAPHAGRYALHTPDEKVYLGMGDYTSYLYNVSFNAAEGQRFDITIQSKNVLAVWYLSELPQERDTLYFEAQAGANRFAYPADSMLFNEYVCRFVPRATARYTISRSARIYDSARRLVFDYQLHGSAPVPILLEAGKTYLIHFPENEIRTIYYNGYWEIRQTDLPGATAASALTATEGTNKAGFDGASGIHIYDRDLYYRFIAPRTGYMSFANVPYYTTVQGRNGEAVPKTGLLPIYRCLQGEEYLITVPDPGISFDWQLLLGDSPADIVQNQVLALGAHDVTEPFPFADRTEGYYIAPADGYLIADSLSRPSFALEMRFGTSALGTMYYPASKGDTIIISCSGESSSQPASYRLRFVPSSQHATLPAYIIASDQEVNAGTEVRLSSLRSDALAYRWDLDGDGADDARGSAMSHTYAHPGEYRIRLIAENCMHSDTAYARITVLDTCAGTFIDLGADTVLAYGEQLVVTAGRPALWYDGQTGTEATISCPRAQGDTLIVWAQVEEHGCTASDTLKVIFSPQISRTEMQGSFACTVFPTCARHVLHLQFDRPQTGTATITDASGVCLFGQGFDSSAQVDIGIRNLPAGHYTISVDVPGYGTAVEHFIRE